MPTLSQCQILNHLVEKRVVAVENASSGEGEDTGGRVQHEQGRPIAMVGYPRAATPQPTHSEYQYTLQETSRPLSVGSKLKNPLATIDADHEVTPFQKQRMQLAEKTAQMIPGWRARALLTKEEASRWRASSSPLLNIRGTVFQRQNTYANLFSENSNSRAFHPWGRAASQRHLPVNLALERLATPENIPEQNYQVPVVVPSPTGTEKKTLLKSSDSNQLLFVPGADNAGSSKPTVRFLDPNPEDESGKDKDEDKATADQLAADENAALAQKQLLGSCSDDVRQQLYQLGFRKPEKKKKKIKKKSEEKARNAKLTYMTMPKLDLMKDPMLRKLSKKSKNVMVQAHPPKMRPKAVCFNVIGAHLTHLLVWKSFKRDVLSEYDEVKVESIQFVPRSIFVPRLKNADPVENRWVITLTNEWYRTRVTGMDIRFGEFTTQLRRYDDVVNLEYRQYTRMTDMMKMIKPKKS